MQKPNAFLSLAGPSVTTDVDAPAAAEAEEAEAEADLTEAENSSARSCQMTYASIFNRSGMFGRESFIEVQVSTLPRYFSKVLHQRVTKSAAITWSCAARVNRKGEGAEAVSVCVRHMRVHVGTHGMQRSRASDLNGCLGQYRNNRNNRYPKHPNAAHSTHTHSPDHTHTHTSTLSREGCLHECTHIHAHTLLLRCPSVLPPRRKGSAGTMHLVRVDAPDPDVASHTWVLLRTWRSHWPNNLEATSSSP